MIRSCESRRAGFCHTCIAAGDDEDTAGLVWKVLLGEVGLGDEETLAEGVQICGHGRGMAAFGDSGVKGERETRFVWQRMQLR